MSDRAEQIVAALTPGKLRQTILELARNQPPDDQGVMVNRIIDTLTRGEDLGTGSEGWEGFLRLQHAVRDTVAQIPGMRYIEADS